jgi:hypothetical protein
LTLLFINVGSDARVHDRLRPAIVPLARDSAMTNAASPHRQNLFACAGK